ncbi:MAG: sugar phosphate isomerase/epimerase [Thermoguttaceae bacterium]|jgi:sugar phosphate isomerase/epimerase|nr:sugar phosphate isomerase/epimerase [Thermoguttaceae bacterium]
MNQLLSTTATKLNRREACRVLAGSLTLGMFNPARSVADTAADWRPNYVLASSMYGSLPLTDILPEVRKTGAAEIDLWPPRHGDQRKAIDELGFEAFEALLGKFDVRLAGTTRFDLGPFGLAEEIAVLKRLGGHTVVATPFAEAGRRNLVGEEAKKAVSEFVEKIRPITDAAAEAGVTVAVENHANSIVCSPDSIRYMADLAPEAGLGVALAPYHLPQDPQLLAGLVEHLGEKLALFYAWQHGDGCMTVLPKEQELKQMPGRGPLDFGPIMAALGKIRFAGPFEIFMHPVPRGIPIMPTVAETTAEINCARAYLESLLQ